MQFHRLSLFGFASLIWLAMSLALGRPVWAQGTSTGDGDLELGARLYNENCAVCHGLDGMGRVGATLAQDWPSISPGVEIEQAVINGVPGSFMPPWSQERGGPLNADEVDAVVAYVLSLQSGGGPIVLPGPTSTTRPPITPIPEVEGDPNRGAVLYDENCLVCHGADAQGRVGATLAKDWPSIRPDVEVKTAIVDGISSSFMPPWSQERGGPLTEADINDLVAYVLSISRPPAQAELTPTTASPTPTPIEVQGGSTGLIVGAVLLVLIIIGGVAWASRRT